MKGKGSKIEGGMRGGRDRQREEEGEGEIGRERGGRGEVEREGREEEGETAEKTKDKNKFDTFLCEQNGTVASSRAGPFTQTSMVLHTNEEERGTKR